MVELQLHGNKISTWYSQNEQLWFKRDANKVNVVVGGGAVCGGGTWVRIAIRSTRCGVLSELLLLCTPTYHAPLAGISTAVACF